MYTMIWVIIYGPHEKDLSQCVEYYFNWPKKFILTGQKECCFFPSHFVKSDWTRRSRWWWIKVQNSTRFLIYDLWIRTKEVLSKWRERALSISIWDFSCSRILQTRV
uniref:Uncharacterized protein n=2 Tax=Cacopsylla melanoneura TaxID=428564 RepID=A0A8D8WBY3_9HEMI